MKSGLELIAQALYFVLTREFNSNQKTSMIILNRISLKAFASFERKHDLISMLLIYIINIE